jgi:hypothetical protein
MPTAAVIKFPMKFCNFSSFLSIPNLIIYVKLTYLTVICPSVFKRSSRHGLNSSEDSMVKKRDGKMKNYFLMAREVAETWGQVKFGCKY